MTIFERVQELSRKQGKTLQKVANDLGFGDNYLYTLKKQKPKADNLEKLADYFHVSVDYLLGRAEAKPVNEPIDLAEVANSDDDAIFDKMYMFVYNECIEKSLNKLTSTAGELIEFVYKGFLLTFYLTEL